MNSVPSDKWLRIGVDITNVGARGGVLTSLEIADFVYIGKPPFLWDSIERTILTSDPKWNEYVVEVPHVPMAIEAGDVETLFLIGPWIHNHDSTHHPRDRAPVWAYAERLRGLDKLELTIEWTYSRVSGGWSSLLGTRKRESVTDQIVTAIDGKAWIEHCRSLWQDQPEALAILDGEDQSFDDFR